MEKYKNLHRWLLIPFIIILLGFANSYWLRFVDAPWRQHLHGITATLWFVILIIQPYLITNGNPQKHRAFGLMALFLAGGMILSALAAIPYNLTSRLPEVAKYGLSFLDVVLVIGFCFALFKAIQNVKNLEEHATWMISTVFWVLGPGLARFLWSSFDLLLGENAPPRFMAIPITGVIIVLILTFFMFKKRKVHPAYLLPLLGSSVFFLVPIIGKAQWWINLANSIFTI